MNAHLAGRALLSAAVAPIDRVRFGPFFFLNGFVEHQRGAAGAVGLHAVVLLHDFHIEALQGARGHADQLAEHVHPQAHVGAAQHRKGLRSLADAAQLHIGIARGAQHHGHAAGERRLQKLRQRVRPGKINQHIGVRGDALISRDDGKRGRLARVGHIHAAGHLYARALRCQRQLAAHASQRSADDDFHAPVPPYASVRQSGCPSAPTPRAACAACSRPRRSAAGAARPRTGPAVPWRTCRGWG